MQRAELVEQGRRTRLSMLNAAAEEFAHAGYQAASLAGIAARLGKPKAALRHHFATKSAIAVAVDEYQFSRWLPVIEAHREAGVRGLPAALSLMSAAIDDSLAEPYALAVIRLRMGPDSQTIGLTEPLFSWFDEVRGRVSESVEVGQLPIDADPADVTRTLLESSFGVHQLSFDAFGANAIVDRFAPHWLQLLRGIGATDPDAIVASAVALRDRLAPTIYE